MSWKIQFKRRKMELQHTNEPELEMPSHSENNMNYSDNGEIKISSELQEQINSILEV
jgi:hypothetical protein